jgi:uncharacterized protein (TIGR02246 family)
VRVLSPLTFVVLICVLSAGEMAAQQRPSPHDGKSAIAALIEQVESANNAGDVDRWVALLAPDLVYMAPGAPAVTTHHGLRDVAKTGFRNQASIQIEPLEIQVFGDWAFARNRVTGTVKLHESGKVVLVDVKQIVIYSKNEQGLWRIARLISNSNTQ